MPDCFRTILIPADLTLNTEVAVKKGLELAVPGTQIHLLHVYNYALYGLPVFYRNSGNKIEIVNKQLDQWRAAIGEAADDVNVFTWLTERGIIQHCIETTAKAINADLIILGKYSHHDYLTFFNKVLPNKIARSTGISVLTVKPGALHNRIKTVVVPITSMAARNKMQMIQRIAKKCSVKVHLIAYAGVSDSKDLYASALIQMYQWLKASLHCQIEYAVLHGKNKAKTLLQYAEKVNADVLLVHPEAETRIGGWWNRHISDVLPAASKMQVLAVMPAA